MLAPTSLHCASKAGTMISIDNFRYISDPAHQKVLFKENVQSVEVEIFSYCNRTCSFCPNSFIDRRTSNTLMNPMLYSKIVDDLAEIDYEGIIWFSRYNEPTSDRVFLKRLKEARRKVPKVKLQTYTNGDYIDADYLAELRDAGLNELRIMAYLPNGTEETQPNYLNLMVQRLTRLGLPWRFLTAQYAQIDFDGLCVSYQYDYFTASGSNRAGALSTGGRQDRQSPCIVPLTSLFIDYNGAMVPCCDIRSDVPAHKNYVTYNLTPEGSLFAAYANSKLVEWRQSLSRFGSKESPCNTCSRQQFDATPEMLDLFGKMAQLADVGIAMTAATEVAA